MKGRATARAALAGQAAAWGSASLLAVPLPSWAWTALNWFGGTAFCTSFITLVVVAAWNIGARREREPEPSAASPPFRQGLAIGEREDGSLVRAPFSPSGTAALLALRRGYAAGTVSVNGRRYLGPPPWGYERTETAYGAGGRVTRKTRLVVQRVLPEEEPEATARVSKSECEGCGVPLGVAWCTPGTPYLCRGCTRGSLLTAGPVRVVRCDACRDGRALCPLDHGRWITPDHAHICEGCVRR